MFNLVVNDKNLMKSLEKLIKKYPLAYVKQNEDGKRFNVVLYNKKTNLFDPFSFSIEKDNSEIYFLVKSKKQHVKINESQFRKKMAKKFNVEIINSCLPQSIPVVKIPGGFLQQATDCFSNFSNLRLNNKKFNTLCLEKFGIEFNLVSHQPLKIEVLDEKQGIYLLIQSCDDKQNFGAIICAGQIQEFMTGYKQLIGEEKKTTMTYQKVPTMLPQKPMPPPMTVSTKTIKLSEVKPGKSEKPRESNYLPSTSTDHSSESKGFG